MFILRITHTLVLLRFTFDAKHSWDEGTEFKDRDLKETKARKACLNPATNNAKLLLSFCRFVLWSSLSRPCGLGPITFSYWPFLPATQTLHLILSSSTAITPSVWKCFRSEYIQSSFQLSTVQPPNTTSQGDDVFSSPGGRDEGHQAGDEVPGELDTAHLIGHQEAEPECRRGGVERHCITSCVLAHICPWKWRIW